MAITVTCTQCKTTVAAPDSAAGMKGRCTVCGQVMDIPLTSDIPSDALPPPEKLPPPVPPADVTLVESNAPPAPAAPSTERQRLKPPYVTRPQSLELQGLELAVAGAGVPIPKEKSELEKLLGKPSQRPAKAPTSCLAVILIISGLMLVLLLGGGTLFYVFAWPSFQRARAAVKSVGGNAAIQRLAMLETTYYAQFREYAPRISGQNSLNGATMLLPDEAAAEAPPGPAQPHHGFLCRILTKQGSNAPGGAKSYIDSKGKMTGGFAILVYTTGDDSTSRAYMRGTNGIVYEKTFDLDSGTGPESIQSFDPDSSWTISPLSSAQSRQTPPRKN